MWRSVIYSILTLVVYFIIIKSFGELFSYILLRDAFLDIKDDYLYLVETIIYSFLIFLAILFIKQRVNNMYAFKSVFSFKIILTILILGFLVRLFEDPFLRMNIILGHRDFPAIENFQSNGVLGKIITFLNVVFLATIFEELVFRKLILSFFKVKNLFFGVIFSSVLFALIHINNIDYINYTTITLAFIFGIIACIIFLKYGLLYCITFHIIYNLIWFVLKEYKQEYWNTLKELSFGIIYWLICSVSLVLVLLFAYYNSRAIKESFSNNK